MTTNCSNHFVYFSPPLPLGLVYCLYFILICAAPKGAVFLTIWSESLNGYGFYRNKGLKKGALKLLIWSEIESGFGDPTKNYEE